MRYIRFSVQRVGLNWFGFGEQGVAVLVLCLRCATARTTLQES
jgi:hypothetical protein